MAGQETHFNCLIIGAGISGIDAAYHLKTYCPSVKYAILERRGNLGGTWDFFKYPGWLNATLVNDIGPNHLLL